MGCGSSTGGGMPRQPRIPGSGPRIPVSGPDIVRIILEALIGEIIHEIIRKQRENNVHLQPMFQTCMMKLSDGENTKSFNGEVLLKSLDADEIPSEYISELQQNPEGLIRSFNLEVPSEYMPEVTAALVEFGRRAAELRKG
ncbi:hypothetical protein U1Q18_028153 [Sarracenia purpurea var. burkii]